MGSLTEDDLYRTSTQYRLWSFTRASLASLRASTNAMAADGVRAAIGNSLAAKATGEDESESLQSNRAQEVDCLTVEEEQKLVGFYCMKAMQFADFCEFPTNVKATAVQFMKRFYLSNSPMTYHPKEIMPSALFLSTKTENHYTSLRSFVSKLPKTTAEDIIAPEFLLTQGLRFTFDVRHPQRGLEGGFMELLAVAKGTGQPGPNNEKSPKQVQQAMLDIEAVEGSGKKVKSLESMVSRIQVAYGKAKDILKTSALLTDAYFFYTPSQLWLAALMQADEPLTRFYVDTKFPTPSSIKPKLINTLEDCVKLYRTSPSAEPKKEEVKELTTIDKKLYQCRNPEKIDLVSINKAQKRDGGLGENGLDEKVIKKRKLERENSEMEAADVFAPAISK